MDVKLTIGSREIVVTASPDPSRGWTLSGVDGVDRLLSARVLAGDIIELTVPAGEGAVRAVRVPFARTEAGTQFSFAGRVFTAAPSGEAQGARRTAKKGGGHLTAPMLGVVADVLVSEGDHVEAHEPLVVIEAMKVMATIEAPFAGIVAKVHFAKGDVAPHGAIVVDVTPDAAASATGDGTPE